MLKLYCQKCGSLNTYGATKPNFCQKCGNSFREDHASAIEAQTSEQPLIDESELIEESQGGLSFNLSELDIEIVPTKRNPDTVGGIMGSAESGNVDVPASTEQRAYTTEDFKKEAGAIRGGNEPEET